VAGNPKIYQRNQHKNPGYLAKFIHNHADAFICKHNDPDYSDHERANFVIKTEQDVHGQSGRGVVRQTESQTAERYEKRNDMAKTRKNLIRHILSPKPAGRNDLPYVQLCENGYKGNHQNDKPKRIPILFRKSRRLHQKARPDCRGKHQERRSQKSRLLSCSQNILQLCP